LKTISQSQHTCRWLRMLARDASGWKPIAVRNLAGVGERIVNLAAEPLVVAGLVAPLTKVEPLLQAADELLPTRMTDGELFHGASRRPVV
jgi:hypothetical protein